MLYDILKIDRSNQTADAQRGKAEKDGYELYTQNRKYYGMRRPADYTPPSGSKGKDENDDEKKGGKK